jgi:threonine synthase
MTGRHRAHHAGLPRNRPHAGARAAWRAAPAQFSGFTLDDDGTLAEIRRLHGEAGYLADPHTAIGTAAARALAPADPGMPVIIAATAHPAKFPDAVEQATGLRPSLPPALADLFEREERFSTLPNELRGAQTSSAPTPAATEARARRVRKAPACPT